VSITRRVIILACLEIGMMNDFELMVVKGEVVRYLRSAEGRSFPKVATDVLLDIKGCFSRS
jgi:hypothetical protein